MKATKYTLKIEAEALSMDCMYGLLIDAAQKIAEEATGGELVMDDGDVVRWTTETKQVEF